MLRPATPLTILLFISFVFLLLSVLSTPVIKSIPIASYKGVNFGVLGYCTPTECSGIRVGYTTNGLFGSSGDGDFNLPSSARQSLSSLLIVHPVAAFCNLVVLALAAAAHFHSPSHSARYLLGLLILLLPTLLVTLLAFLVDILLFVPHLQWGGWIVLASTILITASGVVTCAMRRTLVSRKARKKRIAENAEMSGENFYNRQAQETKIPGQAFSMEPTVPMVNGAPGADRLPTFATFDSSKKLEEDRQPLRSQALSAETTLVPSRDGTSDRFYGPPSSRSGSRPPYDGQRDQFGNPTPPLMPIGAGPPSQGRRSGDERTPPSPYRENSVPPPGGRGYGPRGRGNYPSRGGYPPRGGYGSRGPPPPQAYPGRGGFSADMRGGYGGGRGRGGYPAGAAMGAIAGGMAAGAMMANGQRRPPPGYPPGDLPPDGYPDRMGGPEIAQSQPYIDGENREFTPMSPSVYTTGPEESHGIYGARAQSPGRERMSPYGSRVQSPAGTGHQMSPPPAMPAMPPSRTAELSGAAVQDFAPRRSQSQDPYVPPRSNWNNMSNENFDGPRSPGRYPPAPAELSSENRNVAGYGGGSGRRPRMNSGGSDLYYEDVDPKFATDQVPPLPQSFQDQQQRVPSLLTPGPPGQGAHHRPDSLHLPPSHSYEDLPGARSPAESETSNFTSVSQRGVNPNWRPGNGGEFNSFGPRRPPGGRDQQMRRDVILANNPDFEIPGMGPPGRMGSRVGGSSGRGMIMRGGMNGGPGRMPPPPSAFDGAADGRYPTPVPPVGPPPMNLSSGGVRDI